MNTNSNNVINFYLCKVFKCGFALCHCEEGNSTIFKNWAPVFQCLPRWMRCHKYKEHLLHFSACIPSPPQQGVYTLAWFVFSGSMNECQCGSRWHTRKMTFWVDVANWIWSTENLVSSGAYDAHSLCSAGYRFLGWCPRSWGNEGWSPIGSAPLPWWNFVSLLGIAKFKDRRRIKFTVDYLNLCGRVWRI